MGDNVNHNAAMSEALGLQQGKCIPHALALVVKNSYLLIDSSKTLIVEAGSIISAGGTHKRKEELAKFGLDPKKMIPYTNRFTDVTNKARYRLDNFEAVQLWHTTGKSLTAAKGDCEEDEEDEDDVLPKRLERVKAAYAQRLNAVISLGQHINLYGEIPKLVEDLSAEYDHVPPSVVGRLKTLKAKLFRLKTLSAAKLEIGTILSNNPLTKDLNDSQRSGFIEKFAEKFRQAAVKALASYNKHIEPNMHLYEKKNRFCVFVEPELPDDPGTEEDPGLQYSFEFFDCSRRLYGNNLIAQYECYRKEWLKLKQASPTWPDPNSISNYAFWDGKRGEWPELAAVAIRWSNTPTSSIAAERIFALSRVIDAPQRGRMSWEHFEIEVMLKAHYGILSKLLDDQIRIVGKLRGVQKK
jgi:hypothetical protein